MSKKHTELPCVNNRDTLVKACQSLITASEIIDSSERPTSADINYLHDCIRRARVAIASN